MDWQKLVIIFVTTIYMLVLRRQAYEQGFRDGLRKLADKEEKAEQIYNSFVSYNIQKAERKEE